jgi:hypothetical protein
MSVAAPLLAIEILCPAAVANDCERKLATLFASGLLPESSITVLLVTVNDPVFGTRETGKGIILKVEDV